MLAVEKRISSPLLIPSSIEKIFEIDSHIGAAVSGLVADSRTLIDHARVVGQVRGRVYFTYRLASFFCVQRADSNRVPDPIHL